ncbi:MAG: DUF5009 domain-containing protein [Saprospiraceae bacterium]|nr:DUF5009 domain-containing protein [Saprospiraceae bacterium]
MSDSQTNDARRIRSIDVLRALTMILMIWVNDFWTLEGVPGWLEHMPTQADAMGFSDVIFPAFLVIVGLSIPFALDKRMDAQSSGEVVTHILLRSLALIVMGFFHVNLENIYAGAMVLPKYLWQILLTIAFFLIWNDYQPVGWTKRKILIFQGSGLALLIVLAILYRGGESGQVIGLRRYWWGILGLIGWAYLYAALVYWAFRGRLVAMIGAWVFFFAFHLAHFAGYLDFLQAVRLIVWMPDRGAFVGLVLGGVVASSIYKRLAAEDHGRFIGVLVLMSVLMLVYGWLTRPAFELSKIRATPAWIGYCTAITLLAYAVIYYLVDVRKWDHWYRWIRPAGRSTLTTYLVPYVYYAVWSIWAIQLPVALRTGILGLVKSLLFALLIVGITGLLNRWKIRLKI